MSGLALIVLILTTQSARAANNSYRPPRRWSPPRRLLSINTDPQKIVDTSFRIAAREGRLADMKVALEKGAKLNSLSDEGKTALIYAARRCKTKAVSFLLGRKVDVNIRDKSGRTALIYATRSQCVPVIKLLVKVPGIDRMIKDKSGRSAYDYVGIAAQTRDALGPAKRQ